MIIIKKLGFECAILCVSLGDKSKISEIIDGWSRRSVWIQFIPSCLVISIRSIILAVQLALRDFIRGDNIARKLNLEIGLRYLARTQVREVLEIFRSISDAYYWLVVVSKENVETIAKQIIEQGEICERNDDICFSNVELDLIARVFEVDKCLTEKTCKSRNLSQRKALEMIILEKIALGKILR